MSAIPPSIPIPATIVLPTGRRKRNLWPENQDAWQLFVDCATRHSWTDRDKQEHTGYEVNWQLADILTRRRGLEDEDFEKLLGLAKEMNKG